MKSWIVIDKAGNEKPITEKQKAAMEENPVYKAMKYKPNPGKAPKGVKTKEEVDNKNL